MVWLLSWSGNKKYHHNKMMRDMWVTHNVLKVYFCLCFFLSSITYIFKSDSNLYLIARVPNQLQITCLEFSFILFHSLAHLVGEMEARWWLLMNFESKIVKKNPLLDFNLMEFVFISFVLNQHRFAFKKK
jgi:hypothetical protein